MAENVLIDSAVQEIRMLAVAGANVPSLLRRIQEVLGRPNCGLLSVQCFRKAFGADVASISPIGGWCGFGGELSDAEVDSFVGSVLANYRTEHGALAATNLNAR